MTDPTSPTPPTRIDALNLQNAILFCQNSVDILEGLKKQFLPIATPPAFYQITDSMGQLQNSMLDLLNWASQVNTRLTDSVPK